MAATSHPAGHPTGTLSQQIAEFAYAVTPEDVPPSMLEVAKAHLLDALGTALAATGMDFGQAIHRTAVELGTGTDSRVIGYGTRLPAANAALANGTLIHALDFDDTHIGAIYHATGPALAAALAVGQSRHADGATTLLAYTLGLEIGTRIALVGAGKFHHRGFHPTGIAGAFAATVVASRLRGQYPPTMVNALGLCGSQAAGILEIRESWLKRFHPGWAAHSGLVASTAAGAGFLGPASVFDGPRGLYATHIGPDAELDAFEIDTLGSTWVSDQTALKPYPCCHFTHAFIDAAGLVLDDLGVKTLDPQEVERIECPTSEGMMAAVADPLDVKRAPQTIYQALFSIPYAVALRLVRGSVELAAFYDEPLDDPRILAMATKVSCVPDPDSDYPARFPGEVTIRLRSGEVLRHRVVASRGTPDWPLTAAEVEGKFHANANRALPGEQVDHLAALAGRIESLADVNELVDSTVAPSAAG